MHRTLKVGEARATGGVSTGLAYSRKARGPLSVAETEWSGDGISPAPLRTALIGRAPTDLAGLQQRAMITCPLPTGRNRSRRAPGMASERAPFNITLRGPRCIREKSRRARPYFLGALALSDPPGRVGQSHKRPGRIETLCADCRPPVAHLCSTPLLGTLIGALHVFDPAQPAAPIGVGLALRDAGAEVEAGDGHVVTVAADVRALDRFARNRPWKDDGAGHRQAAITRTASAKSAIAARMWRSWRVSMGWRLSRQRWDQRQARAIRHRFRRSVIRPRRALNQEPSDG